MNMNTYPHSVMTELTSFQAYLQHVLQHAKEHSCDITENNINVARITIDIKRLSEYLFKFSSNLNKLLSCDQGNKQLFDSVFCEIQNFISQKTKLLKDMIPYQESEISHSDWWGKVFKEITQKIWILSENAHVEATSIQTLDILIKNYNLLEHNVKILDCLDRLYEWQEIHPYLQEITGEINTTRLIPREAKNLH